MDENECKILIKVSLFTSTHASCETVTPSGRTLMSYGSLAHIRRRTRGGKTGYGQSEGNAIYVSHM